MKAKLFFSVIAILVLASACATTQLATSPPEPSPDGPKILRVFGLYRLNKDGSGVEANIFKMSDGNYYFAPGRWYRVIVGASSRNKIVKLFNKVDVWYTTTPGNPVFNGTKTFEYDLSKINNCCTELWAPWSRSDANSPGYYQTFTLWVVDENGRISNSVTIGPIVVKGEGGPVVPPKAW